MSPARSPVVLLTDFGADSPYVGAMKGALLSVAPELAIVDLYHGVPAQGIGAAAFLLGLHYRSFPAGAVFLAVVDPGVGSDRRKLIARAGDYYFVGPDNGIFSAVLSRDADQEIHLLENESFWRADRSATFHGRDIFAPAAAHLIRGRSLAEFGAACSDPVRIEASAPVRGPGLLTGHIVYADDFGNLITDVDRDQLRRFCEDEGAKSSELRFGVGRWILAGLSHIYAEAARGEAIALIGSSGQLEIAVNQGNARRQMGLEPGQEFTISISTEGRTR